MRGRLLKLKRRFDRVDKEISVSDGSEAGFKVLPNKPYEFWPVPRYLQVRAQDQAAVTEDDQSCPCETHDTWDEHSDDEPTARSFRDPAYCKLVYYSEDRKELHFVIDNSLHLPAPPRQRKYSFVGIRKVCFSDGERFVGWCSHAECCKGSDSQIQALFEGEDYLGRSQQEFQFSKAQCDVSQMLIQAWTEQRLSEILRVRQVPDPKTGLVKPVWEGLAVRAGPDFDDWGVIFPHKHSERWRCKSCSSVHNCKHISAAQKSEDNAHVILSAEAFDQKLAKDFDLNEGKRKLKCISRQHLPENLQEDPGLLQIYEGRSEGRLSLPDVCNISSDQLQQPCPCCHQIAWGPRQLDPSTVFLPAACIKTHFARYLCTSPGCNGCLTVDGKEYCLLRKTVAVAFALEIMYQWSDTFQIGSPDPWSVYWKHLLAKARGLSDEQRRQHFTSLKKTFSEATLDFIDLQNLDYDGSFSCACSQEGITMDGMTLCFHKSQGRFVHPWLESPDGPSVQGSAFHERIFVHDRITRDRIWSFTSSASEKRLGIQEHEQLCEKIAGLSEGSTEITLLPFLESTQSVDGKAVCKAENAEMLRCLASSAPCCQFMRPSIFPQIDDLIEGKLLSQPAQEELHRSCPCLHAFLRPFLAHGRLPSSVQQLMTACKQVAEAAFVPVGADRYNVPLTSAERKRTQASTAHRASESRPCELWSREEVMLRSCFWKGQTSSQPWQPSPIGGSDVFRSLQRYTADQKGQGSNHTCIKHQLSTANLLPGCMFYWCISCQKCVAFHVMCDAESPRTVFDALYTHWDVPPKLICMDNGCKLHDFCLNREPEHFKNTDFNIDEAHYRGHTRCCPSYSTGAYRQIKNSPLAEQKNRFLRSVEAQASFMKQTTFMWYIRYFLYRLNRLQEDTARGACFFRS